MVQLQYGSIDLFAIPVSILATRRKEYSGSIPGIALTSIFLVLILTFISFKYNDMMTFNLDKYSSQNLANEFEDLHNDFKIDEFNFLPQIEIQFVTES